MDIATTAPQGLDIRAIAQVFKAGRIEFDPLGLVSGYKAYQIYTALAAKSDDELARLGLSRVDLPSVAMRVVQEARKS